VGLGFIVLMTMIVPALSQSLFGHGFRFLGTMNGSLRQAEWHRLPGNSVLNALNYLFISVIPYAWSGISDEAPKHFGVQKIGGLHFVVAAFFASLAVAAAKRDPDRRGVWPALAAFFLCTLYLSVLALSHEPRLMNGYYYGAPLGVLFAVALAKCAATVPKKAQAWVVAGTFWFMGVQALNFYELNSIMLGGQAMLSQCYAQFVKFRADPPGWSYQDMEEVVNLSWDKQLDGYLDAGKLPLRLHYMLAERCALDSFSSARCPRLMQRFFSEYCPLAP
jgi:hypothetical protein